MALRMLVPAAVAALGLSLASQSMVVTAALTVTVMVAHLAAVAVVRPHITQSVAKVVIQTQVAAALLAVMGLMAAVAVAAALVRLVEMVLTRAVYISLAAQQAKGLR